MKIIQSLCAIAAEIKKQNNEKSIIKKKKKKYDKIVLLAKSNLNSTEVLISQNLIDSVISRDEFILTNNVLKEYNEMKKRNQKRKGLIRLSELATRKFIRYFSLFIKQCYRIA